MVNNTKQRLADGLIALAQTKSIENITINEIVKYCNLGRQTFYNHFYSKQDLINWIYKIYADSILQIFNTNTNLLEGVRQIYHFFVDHKMFFLKIARSTDQDLFQKFLFEHSFNYYSNYIVKNFGKETLTDQIIFSIKFNCYGAVNMCEQWILCGMKIGADEMAALILNNIPEDLKKYIN